MKFLTVIVSLIMVFVLMISFSGEAFHVHYCFSSKTYSVDVHPSSENSLNDNLCNCNSSEEAGFNNSDGETCCANLGLQKDRGSCCIDIHADSKSDNQYNFQVFKPQFKALSFLIFIVSEPVFFDSYNTNTFDFNKTRDHSPPEIISSQILRI